MSISKQRLEELLRQLQPYFAGVAEARAHFELAQAYGMHITPNHFYYPIPDTSRLSEEIWQRCSALPGIDMNENGQIELLNEVFSRYTPIFTTFPREKPTNELEFSFANDQIVGADPYILYALVRHLRPQRIVEVGAGYSTLVTARALRENNAGFITCVEPYPRPFIHRAVEGVGQVREVPVQEIELQVFESLEENDILFIDSTHAVRIGGDVPYLFLEVLPRLKPGVWIQVHDIFLPHDYPEEWIKNMNFFWGEQYILQAFLIGNRNFLTRFAVGFMGRRHFALMQRIFPGYQLGLGGGSFWMSRQS